MKKFSTEKIRNICLMSHGGAGKTSFAEAMLFNAGAIDRLGKITEATTTTDYDPEETKRKFSINTAVAPYEWKNIKINVIDTPGYFDFVGEVLGGIRVADIAVILASGRSGVSVGTEKAWELATEKGLPTVFFVNKMDDENANFDNTLEQLKENFGKAVAPFQYPVSEGGKLVGFVDILSLKAYKYDGAKLADMSVPEQVSDEVTSMRELLLEAVAETDENLMEKYFAEEEFSQDEIINAVKAGIKKGEIVPVFCGSAVNNQGVVPFMDAVAEYFPSPADMGGIEANAVEGDEKITLKAEDNEPLSALVFKTIADPFVGKLSMFRVYSGTIKSDTIVYNSNIGANEKIGKLFLLRGKKQIEVSEISAGDIGAVAKLASTVTGNTLCSAQKPVLLDGIRFPLPALSMAIMPKTKGDEEKISSGLRKLEEEDPSFKISLNTETRQQLISGVGEQHLDVIVSKLKTKFGVSVDLIEPTVPYRETLRKKVKVEGKHKKQSGGHGQYGHVWIEFEPGESDDLIFKEKVFGGAVPKNYFPAVE